MVVGCSPGPQTAAGESEMPDAMATTADPLKPARDSEVPPSSTPITTTTSSPTAPVIPSSGSAEPQPESGVFNEDPGKAAALGDDVVIRFEQSGGFAGIEQKWSIYADGRVVGPGGRQGAVGLEEIEKLLETIMGAGFFQMEASYVPLNSCCDRFSYAITVQHDGIAKTVQTIDAAPKQPAQLNEVIDAISALLASLD